jgi:hypothetical protein
VPDGHEVQNRLSVQTMRVSAAMSSVPPALVKQQQQLLLLQSSV